VIGAAKRQRRPASALFARKGAEESSSANKSAKRGSRRTRKASNDAGSNGCLGADLELLDAAHRTCRPSPESRANHPLPPPAKRARDDSRGRIELAFRALAATPLYAVTGTNAAHEDELLGLMCENDGQRAFVGGNLGTPLIDAADTAIDCAGRRDLEFKIEGSRVRPRIGHIPQLPDDHLEATLFDAVRESKLALLRAQTTKIGRHLPRSPVVWRSGSACTGASFICSLRRRRIRYVPARRQIIVRLPRAGKERSRKRLSVRMAQSAGCAE